MTNKEKNRLKDIIISEPHTHISYREKLVYAYEITTKQGNVYFKFIDRHLNKSYYINKETDQVYVHYQGKLVPYSVICNLREQKEKK